jgi:small-conductance mechanosensitive channel
LIPPLNRLGTALLAGVSLVSVIVGFAAQSTLGNLVAGISLVLYKPFRRGDRIQVQAPTASGHEIGIVDDISLGYTVLRTDDQRQIIIANGTMAQQTMIKLAAAPSTASRSDA